MSYNQESVLFEAFLKHESYVFQDFKTHSGRLYKNNALLVSYVILFEYTAFLFSPSSDNKGIIDKLQTKIRMADPSAVFIWSRSHGLDRQEQIQESLLLHIRVLMTESYQIFRSHREQKVLKHLKLLETLSALSFLIRLALAPERLESENITLKENTRFLERQRTELKKLITKIENAM